MTTDSFFDAFNQLKNKHVGLKTDISFENSFWKIELFDKDKLIFKLQGTNFYSLCDLATHRLIEFGKNIQGE